MNGRVGIIGAGITGLTIGYKLQEKGWKVEIFDKGRAVGGRTSSRRTEWGYLDHGAQYLTIRNPKFEEFINTYLPPDLLIPWKANFARLEDNKIVCEELKEIRYTPPHSMSSLCRNLAARLSVKTQTRISKIIPENNWILEDINGNHHGPFDLVIITAPPAQTAELLSKHSLLAQGIAGVEMWPCWTLMLVTENKVELPWGGIKCHHPILGWIALNNSKPERGQLTSIIVQANWEWSAENAEKKRELVEDILQQAAEQALKINFSNIKYKSVHLWRYAAPKNVAKQPYFFDWTNYLAAAGDWCVAGRIEGAFLSGIALAEALL